jgi:hypothetical protein
MRRMATLLAGAAVAVVLGFLAATPANAAPQCCTIPPPPPCETNPWICA